MNRAVIMLLFVLGSVASSAQVAPKNTAATTEQSLMLTSRALAVDACPISLRVQQTTAAFAREVDDQRVRRAGQRLHLVVENSPGAGPSGAGKDAKTIVAANLTVSGFTAKGRVLQTSTTSDLADAARTLNVEFAEGENQGADIWVRGFSAVRTVDLNSVSYADGSEWNLPAGRSCRTLVDGLMLVGTR